MESSISVLSINLSSLKQSTIVQQTYKTYENSSIPLHSMISNQSQLKLRTQKCTSSIFYFRKLLIMNSSCEWLKLEKYLHPKKPKNLFTFYFLSDKTWGLGLYSWTYEGSVELRICKKIYMSWSVTISLYGKPNFPGNWWCIEQTITFAYQTFMCYMSNIYYMLNVS